MQQIEHQDLKIKKEVTIQESKARLLKMEGTRKKIGTPPSLEADQPPPPLISYVDAGKKTSLDPIRSTLLDGKGNFGKDYEMPASVWTPR